MSGTPNHALAPVVQVLVALRFYARGSFLPVIGDTVGLSKSTVSNIITNVSEALAVKKQQFIAWPSQDEINVVKEGFYRKGGFPAVIGCIDGTHVRIQRPTEHENDFVNRKRYHSVNVQAICNHKGKTSFDWTKSPCMQIFSGSLNLVALLRCPKYY